MSWDQDCSCSCHDCPECDGGCDDDCDCECHECCSECATDDQNDDDDEDDSEEDEESGDRLITISRRIQRVSRTSYSVRVVGSIEGDYIQACANHGTNTIDVTEGLIDAMDDDELAFVISHEVAHFLNQDNERTREVIDQGLEATVEATRSLRGKGLIKQLLGSVIILTAGVAGTFVASRLASQEHETEADQLALEYMQQAEYDPQSAISALEKLYGGSLPNYDLWEGIVASFIQTHPEPARRGRNILKRL